MAHDLNRLTERIDRIRQSFADIDELNEILPVIIHKPGFTSIAEFALIEVGLESIHQQIETAIYHYKQLLEAAGKVGEI